MYYPEFVWTLAGDTIVRDGVALNPKSDYIDSATRVIKLFIPFFVPSTQVATLTMATIDLTDVKPVVSLTFNQLKILSGSEIATVLGCTIAAIILGFIGIALAFPAAVQELREVKDLHLKWVVAKLNRIAPSKFVRMPTIQRRKYTSNTTQPDVLDVLLNVGLIFLLIAFLVEQLGNNSTAEDTFTSIADIDWSGDMDFQEKIGVFLDATQKAVDVVSMEDKFMSAAFWTFVFCCIRMILYMKMHPSISSIAETFESTGGEILNFLFSFGLVYIFLAFIAHIRFGYLYDEFATIEQSLITQFSLLIGDSSPDYTNNALMCIYVVSYVFICTFSLLNFLLAIVVNGYTRVTERVLENRVAKNLFQDLFTVAADAVHWTLNPSWPSKLDILRGMQEAYPDVFLGAEEIVRPLPRSIFVDIVVKASCGKANLNDGDRLFNHYARFEVMLMEANKDSTQSEDEVKSLMPDN
uniref:Polycystin cation channel PKD1/PKD2 domain-containing protein n=1 Tax=Tetraselmis sp. GSL018 TaxID=582737 RepID=A0A061S5N1_9CHLO